MPKTVTAAFDLFLKDSINLDSAQTQKAKTSRAWLIEQINTFYDKDGAFPTLYQSMHINFGSFSRKTKIRELDDIDIMICLSGEGGTYLETSDTISISPSNEGSSRLHNFCDEQTGTVNSRKIINKFVQLLKTVTQYKNADIKRNQEAATLSLTSYPWVFDIVPCFITKENEDGISFYLIPDGQGNWKKTDPRIDHERIQRMAKDIGSIIYPVIRLVKYWNKHSKIPTMDSYLTENIVLKIYEEKYISNGSIDTDLQDIFKFISRIVFQNIEDPKRIQGDLNNLTIEEKQQISERAYRDYQISFEAIQQKINNDMKSAIVNWITIFGDSFPKYEE